MLDTRDTLHCAVQSDRTAINYEWQEVGGLRRVW
jgi:hypothetical protein